jgi:hypothetical protein
VLTDDGAHTYLHSSGSRPSGSVEEVGLPMTEAEAALEACACPAGAGAFLAASLEEGPLAGAGTLDAAGPATLSLLSCPLDTASLLASNPI